MGYPDKFIIKEYWCSDILNCIVSLREVFGSTGEETAIAKSMMEFIRRNEIKSKIGKKENQFWLDR
ncbi:MAG: hypothetical protein IPK08_20030 [Bacteroidetes bacterium]|nr:hypothetical protein [Bacteroidota bacterium]